MHEQLLELADSPPDLEQYTPYVQYGPPVLIYGVPIKNSYDHERLTLSQNLEPKRLRVGSDCFYGTILQPTRLLNKVCSVATSVPIDHPDCVNIHNDNADALSKHFKAVDCNLICSSFPSA